MINFVVRDDKRSVSLYKVRRVVVAWTSLCLGIYIVAVGGLVGWNTLWSSKERKATSQEILLRQQIAMYSEQEVLAAKLFDRAATINSFLVGRDNIYEIAGILPREGVVTVNNWEYTLGGTQRVSVHADGVEKIKEYEVYLQDKYEQVQIERVYYDKEQGWVGALLLTGRKKV